MMNKIQYGLFSYIYKQNERYIVFIPSFKICSDFDFRIKQKTLSTVRQFLLSDAAKLRFLFTI